MAPRKRKPATTADSQAAAEDVTVQQRSAADSGTDPSDPATEFDPAKLEGERELDEDELKRQYTGAVPPTSVMTPVTAHRPPVMPKISDTLPDPRGIDQISLDDDRNGPKMRLLRSHRHREVLIQFDSKPQPEIIAQIKAQDFRWEPRVEVNDRMGAWAKHLEDGREIRGMLDAERLFKDLGNSIRRSKGLEPVGQVGVSAD